MLKYKTWQRYMSITTCILYMLLCIGRYDKTLSIIINKTQKKLQNQCIRNGFIFNK